MKRILFISGILLYASSLFAQMKPLSEEKRKEFEAQKIAFFTQEMELTPEEAAKFWPLYNEMQLKIREEKEKFWKALKEQGSGEVTEKQAQILINTMLESELKEYSLKKEYYHKIIKALSAKKLWLMFEAERNFHRQLWRKLGTYSVPKAD